MTTNEFYKTLRDVLPLPDPLPSPAPNDLTIWNEGIRLMKLDAEKLLLADNFKQIAKKLDRCEQIRKRAVRKLTGAGT